MPTIDFDLCDYEEDIKKEYCHCDCLLGYNEFSDSDFIKDELRYYVAEMEKNLYGYINNEGLIKTYEEVYRDLKDMIGD